MISEQALKETLRQIIPSFPEAKCQDLDPDFMFPDSQDELERRLPQMVATCMSCVHRFACRDLALENNLTEGIWGGTTPSMRRQTLEGRIRAGVDSRTEKWDMDKVAIFVKRYKAGIQLMDIADSLNITTNTATKWVQRCKERGLL